MKILCVIDSLNSGGAQRQLVELAISFKEIRYEVIFLIYHKDEFYESVLEEHKIPIVCISEVNYVKRFIKMRRFIRRGRFDVVISFLEASNFICELSGLPFRKWKLIVGERSANPNIYKSIRLYLYRWFHLFADYIVSNSRANMHMVRNINPLIPKSKCRVIYNSLNLDYWKSSEEYTPRANKKLNIIIAARHHNIKNVNGLINALLLFNDAERSKLKIEWYGDVADDSFNSALVRIKEYSLENIISFFPASNEINIKMQSADVVALFSLYEGFPNSICEGMACGKTILCSAISDIPFVLPGNNSLFDPKDSYSIYRGLSYILGLSNEELANIGEQNRLVAEQLFRKDRIIAQYKALIQNEN